MEIIIHPKLDDTNNPIHEDILCSKSPNGYSRDDYLLEVLAFLQNNKVPLHMGTVSPNDLVSSIAKTMLPKGSGIIPESVRWISDDHKTVVWERPPMSREISITPLDQNTIMDTLSASDVDNVEKSYLPFDTFTINIPWQVYFINFDDNYNPEYIYMWFTCDRLKSLDDPLYLPPLPNIYLDGSICMPYGAAQGSDNLENKNISSGLTEAYQLVWGSGWNYDLILAPDLYINLNTFICPGNSVNTLSSMIEDYFRPSDEYGDDEELDSEDWDEEEYDDYDSHERLRISHKRLCAFYLNWSQASMDEVLNAPFRLASFEQHRLSYISDDRKPYHTSLTQRIKSMGTQIANEGNLPNIMLQTIQSITSQ